MVGVIVDGRRELSLTVQADGALSDTADVREEGSQQNDGTVLSTWVDTLRQEGGILNRYVKGVYQEHVDPLTYAL